MPARVGIEVNVACKPRRDRGEKQWVPILAEEGTVFVEDCNFCGSDENPKKIVLELDTDRQYVAKSETEKFTDAVVHGRCGLTGKNYRVVLNPVVDVRIPNAPQAG